MFDGWIFWEIFGLWGVIKFFVDGFIEDIGLFIKKCMEIVDEEILVVVIDFIKCVNEQGQFFYVWWNGMCMYFWIYVKFEMMDQVNEIVGKMVDEYIVGMIEYDLYVGQLFDLLDELGIVDNIIVYYLMDNGLYYNIWLDVVVILFFGEKNINWEGGWWVLFMVCWFG